MEGQVFALNHQKAFHEDLLMVQERRSWEEGGGPGRDSEEQEAFKLYQHQKQSSSQNKERNLNQHRLNRLLEGFYGVKQTSKGPEMDPGAAGGWVGRGVEESRWDSILLFLPDVPEGQADESADPDQQNHTSRPRFDPEQQVSPSRSLVLTDASEFRPLWMASCVSLSCCLIPLTSAFLQLANTTAA